MNLGIQTLAQLSRLSVDEALLNVTFTLQDAGFAVYAPGLRERANVAVVKGGSVSVHAPGRQDHADVAEVDSSSMPVHAPGMRERADVAGGEARSAPVHAPGTQENADVAHGEGASLACPRSMHSVVRAGRSDGTEALLLVSILRQERSGGKASLFLADTVSLSCCASLPPSLPPPFCPYPPPSLSL
jgi:hypothetical protein